MNDVIEMDAASDVRPLRRILMLLGKTQTQLAEDMNVTTATVSDYVNGLVMPHPKRIHRMALALGLKPPELIEILTSKESRQGWTSKKRG